LATVVSLYSHLEDGSQELGIQSRESFETGIKIPVGFSTQITAELEYKISIDQLEGANLEAATVYLIDNQTATVHNLSDGAYSFSSNKGTFHNRFTLQFEGEVILGTSDIATDSIAIFPNPTDGQLNIVSPQEPITRIEVYDVRGRKVRAIDYNRLKAVQIDISTLDNSMYFLKINTLRENITKRVIKK
ncbi:MAG: T9SS type A sorting domain-containing protein, partial [Bacteroidota bacterium]